LPSNPLEGVTRRRAERRRRRTKLIRIAGLTVVLGGAFMITSMLGTHDRSEPSDAACTSTLIFDGIHYSEYSVVVRPAPGDRLGRAVIPACAEGEASAGPDIEVEVARVPGVAARTAVVIPDDPSSIFVRDGIDYLSPELLIYFTTPPCKSDVAQLTFQGPWLGILGADGDTELDMIPPYDVEMLVEDSTDPLFELATLTIRVPPSLGRPLTREDVRTSLWGGGDIRVSVYCSGDSYLAKTIEAMSP
jgi:hypothetical protein